MIGQVLSAPAEMLRPAAVAVESNVQDVTAMQPQLLNRVFAADTVSLAADTRGIVAALLSSYCIV